MNEVMAWLASRDWPEVIRTLAPLATLGVAVWALRNWQRQDRAKREAEFLVDHLVEAAHAYIAGMAAPITLVRFAKLGMESHAPTWEQGDEAATALKGAVAYIEKYGQEESKRLQQALDAVRPAMTRLRSLASKGQVFRFKGYPKCLKAVEMLTWQFDRAQGMMMILSQTNLNWDNPDIQKSLQGVIAIDADAMYKALAENEAALIEFVDENYQYAYGWRQVSTSERRPRNRGHGT